MYIIDHFLVVFLNIVKHTILYIFVFTIAFTSRIAEYLYFDVESGRFLLIILTLFST